MKIKKPLLNNNIPCPSHPIKSKFIVIKGPNKNLVINAIIPNLKSVTKKITKMNKNDISILSPIIENNGHGINLEIKIPIKDKQVRIPVSVILWIIFLL
ncbi:Uncharacterised protein [Mesomycoplasma neurolyticum]|uniref:Uncharacterized protein n=1 Tax=Mesomycoplasma neurolyticum TaxID=2120 RepID=A0A449A573_9BACT|nr:hypothetical protein [Mesomycoplasma neurolyticum]VEU59364.1 Uncharacterised protein [Mesomycoplasma neurolyticum]